MFLIWQVIQFIFHCLFCKQGELCFYHIFPYSFQQQDECMALCECDSWVRFHYSLKFSLLSLCLRKIKECNNYLSGLFFLHYKCKCRGWELRFTGIGACFKASQNCLVNINGIWVTSSASPQSYRNYWMSRQWGRQRNPLVYDAVHSITTFMKVQSNLEDL